MNDLFACRHAACSGEAGNPRHVTPNGRSIVCSAKFEHLEPERPQAQSEDVIFLHLTAREASIVQEARMLKRPDGRCPVDRCTALDELSSGRKPLCRYARRTNCPIRRALPGVVSSFGCQYAADTPSGYNCRIVACRRNPFYRRQALRFAGSPQRAARPSPRCAAEEHGVGVESQQHVEWLTRASRKASDRRRYSCPPSP